MASSLESVFEIVSVRKYEHTYVRDSYAYKSDNLQQPITKLIHITSKTILLKSKEAEQK